MMFHWKQERTQGLLAKSLYESLNEAEQRELDRALETDPSLRADRDAFRTLVDSIPVTALEQTPNLLPLLTKRMDAPQRRGGAFRMVFAGAAAMFIVVLSAATWYSLVRPQYPGHDSHARTGQPNTLVAQALAEAKTLLAKRDTTAAYEVLREALQRQPGDASAGEAQWILAECAFNLNRYSEAYDACSTLFAKYYASLEDDADRREQAIHLREILAEAKKVEFASLQAFDVAKRDRVNTLAALENVATEYAKYQGADQYALGDLVAKEMAVTVAKEIGVDIDTPGGIGIAYKSARDRCTSPTAIAFLDMKIGDVYAQSLNDPIAAKGYYRRAAENPVVASLAAKALERIE